MHIRTPTTYTRTLNSEFHRGEGDSSPDLGMICNSSNLLNATPNRSYAHLDHRIASE